MRVEGTEQNLANEQVEITALLRPERDRPAERSCMSCGAPFNSEGWHNRLCNQCRKRSEPVGCPLSQRESGARGTFEKVRPLLTQQ